MVGSCRSGLWRARDTDAVPARRRSLDGVVAVNHGRVSLRERGLGELSPVCRQIFLQCADSCERALTEYANEVGMARQDGLFGCLLRAIAAVRTAVDLLDVQDSRRELALRVAAEACIAAAARCRQAGLDTSLLRCAVACDRAADEAQLVLSALAH